MLADAFVLAQLLPEKVSVVDVGTGAGGPALGLAFLRPDLAVTLVEPLAKRTSFSWGAPDSTRKSRPCTTTVTQ